MPEERSYSEKEVSRILKRAVELQTDAARSPGDVRQGLALSDLEEIARGAGIDPEFVRRAAGEAPAARGGGFLKALTGIALVRERKVRCDTGIAEANLRDLEEVIDSAMNLQGKMTVRRNAFTWKSDTMETYNTGVKFSVRGRLEAGAVEVTVGADLTLAAGGILGGLVGGMGLGTGLGVGLGVGLGNGMPLFALLFPLGMLAGSWILSRIIMKRMARGCERRLLKTAEALERELRSGSLAPAPQSDAASNTRGSLTG